MRRMIAVAVLALTLVSAPAMANEGFYIGADLLFNDIGGDIKNVDTGNGLGLKGGYGLNRYLSFEAGVFKTQHDFTPPGAPKTTVDFKGLTIDAKLSFPLTGSHIEPYIFGGVGSYKLEDVKGKGGQLGIGMDIYLFPELNFNIGLSRKNIKFDSTPEETGNVTTLDFGINYHFI